MNDKTVWPDALILLVLVLLWIGVVKVVSVLLPVVLMMLQSLFSWCMSQQF